MQTEYSPGPDDIEQIDPDRTQLYVANFNGGVGKVVGSIKKRLKTTIKINLLKKVKQACK